MLAIDHIVISVQDLHTASETFRNLGFTVKRGGKHASGITHNAVIIFGDGTYIELLSLVKAEYREDSEFKALLRETDGFTGFGLYSDNIVRDLAAIMDSGLKTDVIEKGSRTRTDGMTLHWRLARLDYRMCPFLLQDETPRRHRVPAMDAIAKHKNGARGIENIQILVDDLEAETQRYRIITRSQPKQDNGQVVFALRGADIILRCPQTAEETQYQATFGNVPYQVVIKTEKPHPPITADDAHGARFTFDA